MYAVRLTRHAHKAFEDADAALQRKLDRCCEALARDPRRQPNARKLKGKLSAYWRYRVGTWRVLYRIDDQEQTVWVVAIEHRRDVYR